jgi:hypothetical protein
MPDAPFRIITNERTHMVVETATGRALGGFGANFYRPWVFPLYTPRGLTVVQEFAFDHPFHNGVFVAQNPVEHPGGVANFWAAPPRRSHDDALFAVPPGRMDPDGEIAMTPGPDGASFALSLTWRDANERPVLAERRTVAIYAAGGATICEMASEKTAAFGPVRFPKTKFGSIGIRVEPRLLPPLGGVVIADGARGDASVGHETAARTIAYENRDGLSGDGRFGVLLSRPDADTPGPWFIRDYGMALWNPTWAEDVDLPHGETWRLALRVVAYDGALDDTRAAGWASLPARV